MEWNRWLAALLMVLLPGCLGPSYVVPLEDLAAQTRLPPEQRGRDLRVIQQTGGQAPPRSRGAHPSGYVGPIVIPPPPPHRVVASGIDFGNLDDDGEALVVLLAVMVTVGVLVSIGILSAIEASRYDGWVDVAPDQGVYLLGYDRRWYRVPLGALVPQDVAATRLALIREDEGAFHWRGLAPLERPGFAYGLDLGASGNVEVGSRDAPFWPATRIRIGAFPVQWLGIYGVVAFVFGADDGTLLNFRYGGEVQALPLALGPIHLGLYGQVADNHRLYFPNRGAAQDDHNLLWGGGLLVEADVTTHLGVTLRGGVNVVHEGDTLIPVGEIAAGATIY